MSGVGFLAVSTHARALAQCGVSDKLVLGNAIRFGLGTGGDPRKATRLPKRTRIACARPARGWTWSLWWRASEVAPAEARAQSSPIGEGYGRARARRGDPAVRLGGRAATAQALESLRDIKAAATA